MYLGKVSADLDFDYPSGPGTFYFVDPVDNKVAGAFYWSGSRSDKDTAGKPGGRCGFNVKGTSVAAYFVRGKQ